MKKIILIFIGFMIFPFIVFADCASDFKAIEQEFKVYYKYNKDTDDFDITFVNPDKTKYTFGYHDRDEIGKFTISIQNNKEKLLLKNYKGSKYEYNFVAISGNCKNNVANSGTIELKKYNPYSDSELCKGHEEFVLCQREYDKAIDEETFKSRLESYVNSKNESAASSNVVNNNNNNNNNDKKTIDNNSNFISKILNYIQEHIITVIIIIVVTIALIISIIAYVKKIIKSRRLE